MDIRRVTEYSTLEPVPYILTELPSNLLLKRLRPNLVLPALVIAWGIVSTLQGACSALDNRETTKLFIEAYAYDAGVVTSYHGLLAARFFLGFCEGAALAQHASLCSTHCSMNY